MDDISLRMNRAGLEETACECYEIVRKEFEKLGLL